MLKIIHTGDLHLGAGFSSFGKNAAKQRQSLLDVFRKIVDTAIYKKADILLISGDLFDSNFPSYETVKLVKEEFRKLDQLGIYVAVLPGTHDCFSKDSIYKREDFVEDLTHIFVFDDKTFVKKYDDLDLSLYAKANISNKSKRSPFDFLKAQNLDSDKSKHKVLMAHGSLQIEGKSSIDDFPFSFEDIENSKMDYVALGHWHGTQDFSSGGVKAWYCGSPEITYKEGKGGLGQGYILEIDILHDVEVNPVKVSEKVVEELDIDLGVVLKMESLYKEIEAVSDKNKILILNISGAVDSDVFFEKEKIEKDFEDKFFSIKVKNNISLKMDNISEKDYPEEMVLGQFIRIMQDKIEKAKDEKERLILKEVLQMGVMELEGKNVF